VDRQADVTDKSDEAGAPLRLIVYGDSCSGVAGAESAADLARIHAEILRVAPRPPLLVFMGDHVAGYCEANELRRQWRHFFAEEFAEISAAFPHVYHLTSNHSLYDSASLEVWREVFAFLPDNGPPGQEKLAFWARHGEALLVFLNTLGAMPNGEAQLEWTWLNEVLNAHRDAAIKLVFGHHPIHAVNGYARYPMWRADPAEGGRLWDVLVRHRVAAYFCSHIIAFDVQVHQGVLQVCTAGAGTRYGPGGAMPGCAEYLHFVEAAVSPAALTLRSRDIEGRVREAMRWPMGLPQDDRWLDLADIRALSELAPGARLGEAVGEGFVAFRLRGVVADAASEDDQILFCGWNDSDAAPSIQLALSAGAHRLTLSLFLEAGRPPIAWLGPRLAARSAFELDLALRPSMGPGGCLVRLGAQPWSSMTGEAAEGAADLVWPKRWSIGCGPSGARDRRFLGADLTARAATSAA
jgi:hypothetical protein